MTTHRWSRESTPRAVIFDCDGTLVDSERLAIQVIVEMAAEYGVALELESALKEFRGTRIADCVAHIEAKRDAALPQTFVPEYRARMEKRFRDDLQPVAGAHELLRSIRLPVAVASNGPREKMALTLSIVGLLTYFDGHIYSAYDIGHWKPDPKLFLHVATQLNVAPERCVVIEDSVPGIRGALSAGMTVFALNNEHLQLTQDLLDHPRLEVVQSLVDLMQ